MAGILTNSFMSWMISGGDAKEFFRRQRVNKKKQRVLIGRWNEYQKEQAASKTGTSTSREVRPLQGDATSGAKGSREQETGTTVRTKRHGDDVRDAVEGWLVG